MAQTWAQNLFPAWVLAYARQSQSLLSGLCSSAGVPPADGFLLSDLREMQPWHPLEPHNCSWGRISQPWSPLASTGTRETQRTRTPLSSQHWCLLDLVHP